MIRLQRGPAPEFWTRERVKSWTQRWIERRGRRREWQWPRYGRKRINEYACTALEGWHYNKCAFCEAPLLSGREVEHFRSKTKYPLAAYVWRNLFLVCRACNQAKRDLGHERCIKPDRDDPLRYLWVNPVSLRVEPRQGISEENRQRAHITIKTLGLDRPELAELHKWYVNHLKTVLHRPLTPADLSMHSQPDRPFSMVFVSLLQYYRTSS